jgi:voltage-gated potassium channel
VLVIAKEDWDAAFIVMNSRKVNSDAVIVANVNRERSAEKLYSLGASRVVFSLSVSGHLIASSAASPVLAEFMDRIILTQDIEIGHLEVGKDSKLSGRTLSDVNVRERTGCWVIGLINEKKTFMPNPGPNEVIKPGQTLICLGKSEDLRRLFENVKSG